MEIDGKREGEQIPGRDTVKGTHTRNRSKGRKWDKIGEKRRGKRRLGKAKRSPGEPK